MNDERHVLLKRDIKTMSWLLDMYNQNPERAKKLAGIGNVVDYDYTTWYIIVDFEGERLSVRRYNLIYLD